MEGGIMADLRASGLGGIPKGTTSDRPSSPSIGDVFYNGTLGILEIYTSQGWVANSSAPAIPVSVSATNQGSERAYNNGQASVSFTSGTGGLGGGGNGGQTGAVQATAGAANTGGGGGGGGPGLNGANGGSGIVIITYPL